MAYQASPASFGSPPSNFASHTPAPGGMGHSASSPALGQRPPAGQTNLAQSWNRWDLKQLTADAANWNHQKITASPPRRTKQAGGGRFSSAYSEVDEVVFGRDTDGSGSISDSRGSKFDNACGASSLRLHSDIRSKRWAAHL
jgi:hypothetical protein